MKNFILSLILALFGTSLAQQAPTSVIIDFPFFLYAYNNLDTVTFDFTTDTAGALPGFADGDTLAGTSAANTNIEVANLTNLNTCIDDIVSTTPPSVTQTGTNFDGSTDNGITTLGTDTCLFAPSDVTRYGTFSVTNNDADGWLLVFTNSNSWSVDATLDVDFTNFDDATLHIAAEVLSDSAVTVASTASIVDATAVDLADETDFFYTDRRLMYTLPLNYILELDPLESPIGDPGTVTDDAIADDFYRFHRGYSSCD